MLPFLLSVLSLCACVMSIEAVRYGDYAAHLPQYGELRGESDSAAALGDYGDRSPDAPAPLDYKYEEELHGKHDDLIVKQINDANVWDKPNKKRRKPPISRDANVDLDLDENEHERKSNRRLIKHRTKLRNRNLARQREPQKRLKHNLINRNDNIANFEIRNDFVYTEDAETVGNDDMDENNNLSHKQTIYKNPSRKPRDRSLQNPEWRERKRNLKLEEEEIDLRLDKDNFESKSARGLGEIIHREGASKKNRNNYDYEEYYDMKRVQNIKSRLPSLFRQTTVRTLEVETSSHSEHWLQRRSNPPTRHSAGDPDPTTSVKLTKKTTRATTTSSSTTTTKTTTKTQSSIENSSDLSLAEKSRLSILKKVQRKESSRNVSSTKPPVLMQVTSKMQTVVMVEPRSPETMVRAREALGDSPELRRRARKLMRRKLVAGARSIHDLTENWDEMVCDYIDLSLLEADASFRIRVQEYITLLILLPLLNLNYYL